jgi:hypothetical protein
LSGEEKGNLFAERDKPMRAHFAKLGPSLVVIAITFGVGVVLGRSEIGKEAVAPPASVTVRQEVEPAVTVLQRTRTPNLWYELPDGYRITQSPADKGSPSS